MHLEGSKLNRAMSEEEQGRKGDMAVRPREEPRTDYAWPSGPEVAL